MNDKVIDFQFELNDDWLLANPLSEKALKSGLIAGLLLLAIRIDNILSRFRNHPIKTKQSRPSGQLTLGSIPDNSRLF